MTTKEYIEVGDALSQLEADITAAFYKAKVRLERFSDSLEDPCSTCDGEGTVPVLEHQSGDNLPPGGVYLPGDKAQVCPDCHGKGK